MRLNDLKRQLVGGLAALFLVASNGSAWSLMASPDGRFQPVYQPLYEEVLKLKKGVPDGELKKEELSVLQVSSQSRLYTIIRYCRATSDETCPISIYRDEVSDQNYFGSMLVPAFASYWDTELKLCELCSPVRPLDFHFVGVSNDRGCSITVVFADSGVLQYLGCSAVEASGGE